MCIFKSCKNVLVCYLINPIQNLLNNVFVAINVSTWQDLISNTSYWYTKNLKILKVGDVFKFELSKVMFQVLQ